MNALEQLLYDSAIQAKESNRLINELISYDKDSTVLIDEEGTNVPSVARRVHLYLSQLKASGVLDGEDAIGLSTANINGSGDLEMTLTNGITLNLGRVEGLDGKGIQDASINGNGEMVLTYTDATTANLGVVEGTDGLTPTNFFIDGTDLKVDLSDGSTVIAGDISQFGGISAQTADITEAGDLVIVYTDGTVENVGRVVGAKGDDGLHIVTSYLDQKGQLVLLMSDNTEYTAGKVQKTVIDGTTKSVDSASIDGNGHLIITLSDATTIDAGTVVGTDGVDGQDGRDITSVLIEQSGDLAIGFSDGTTSRPGVVQKTIIDGSNVSIADATINPSGELVLNVWDGSTIQTYNLGVVNGQDGADGVSVSSAGFVGDTLTFTLSDGATISAGDVDRSTFTAAAINGSGELELTYTKTDGTTQIENLGVVMGSDGTDGVSVTGASIDGSGNLVLTLSAGGPANVGKVVAEHETNVVLNGTDLEITFSDGSTQTFAGIAGADGADGDYVNNVSILSDGTLQFGTSQGATITAGPVTNLITTSEIDVNGNLILTLTGGSTLNVGKVTAEPGADGADGRSVSSIDIVSGGLQVTLEDGGTTYVSNIIGSDGTDGIGVQSFDITAQDMIITLDDSSTVTVPLVKGVDGQGVTNISAADGVLTFDMVDGSTYTAEGLVGKDGVSITDITSDSNFVTFYKSDGTQKTVETRAGQDGTSITDVSFVDQDLVITLSDGVVSTVPTVKGQDALGIDTMVADANGTTTTLTDGSTVNVPFAPAQDGVDGNGVKAITITPTDELEFTMDDDTVINGGTLGAGIQTASIDGNGDLILTLTDTTTLNVGRVKATDGKSVTGASLDVNDDLIITLNDGTTFNAGTMSRVEVSSVTLDTGDLIMNMSDGSTINAGRVNGLDGRYVTGATVDVNNDLILSMNRDGDINAGNVAGDPGLAIASAEVKLNGDLIITMTDDSVVNAGNVGTGAGLTVWETGNTYDQDRVVVHNQNMYIALAQTTTEPPSADWRAFAFGDELPEIRIPTCEAPVTTSGNLNPELVASPYAPLVSTDARDYREFQVDIDTGDFSAPVYTAQEDADVHQVATPLSATTAYKWRCRDVSALTGFTTEWSDPLSFSTPGDSIAQPTVSEDASETLSAMTGAPIFQTSAFAMAVGSDTHASTDWKITRTSDSLVVWSSLADATNLVAIEVPFGELNPGVEYQIEARHNGASLVSAWSAPLVFTTESAFDYITTPSVFAAKGNETEMNVNPDLVTSAFGSDPADTHVSTDWEVVRVSDGVTVDSSIDDATNLLSYIVSTELAQGDYQVRVKHAGERFGKSDWSPWLNITVTGPSIDKPTVSTPELINNFPQTGEIRASAFSGTNETHVSTDWEVRRLSNDEVLWSSYFDVDNLTSINVNLPLTADDIDVKARVRFRGGEAVSAWSDDLSLHTESSVDYILYAGGDTGATQYDDNGSELWVYDAKAVSVQGVAGDDQGNSYAGHNSPFDITKHDFNGLVQWTATGHTATIRNLATDGAYVYSVSNDQTVRKWDATDGSQVWSFTGHTNYVLGVAVDDAGNVYTGSRDNTVKKIDSTGTEVWSFTGHTNYVCRVAVDIDGNVYTASRDSTVKKIDSLGNEVWSFSLGTEFGFAVDVHPSGNVFCGDAVGNVKKIDSLGNEVWSTNISANIVYDVSVDSSGNVYAGTGGELALLDSDGNIVWTIPGRTWDVDVVGL